MSQFDRQTVPCSRSSHSETTIAKRRVSPQDRTSRNVRRSDDSLLAGRSCLQNVFMSHSIVIPRRRTSPPSRVGVSKVSICVPLRLTNCLFPVPDSQTYGDRAFPVAAVQICNSLPQHITSAPSLPVFCCRLKTHFFELCYR